MVIHILCLFKNREEKLYLNSFAKAWKKFCNAFTNIKRWNVRRSYHASTYSHAGEYPIPNKSIKFYECPKGKSLLMIFDKHVNLKYKFGNRKFWVKDILSVRWASMRQLSKNISKIRNTMILCKTSWHNGTWKPASLGAADNRFL